MAVSRFCALPGALLALVLLSAASLPSPASAYRASRMLLSPSPAPAPAPEEDSGGVVGMETIPSPWPATNASMDAAAIAATIDPNVNDTYPAVLDPISQPDGYFSDGFYEMNLIAMNDKDEIYEDPEYAEMGELEELSTEVDESEDTDDTGASVEAAVKQEEEIVTMGAAAVNDRDGDGVNTFAAAIVVEDEAVNANYMGVEAVKGDIMVKGSKVKATAKGRVLTKEEHVEGLSPSPAPAPEEDSGGVVGMETIPSHWPATNASMDAAAIAATIDPNVNDTYPAVLDPISQPAPPPYVAQNQFMDPADIGAALDQIDARAVAYSSTLEDTSLPEDAPEEVANWTNTLATDPGYASYPYKKPRFHPVYGLAVKKPNGKWYTYINNNLSLPGVDDWATGFKTCRFTQPDPVYGFNCTEDATCPGCPYCRAQQCFFNRHWPTYRNPKSDGTIPGQMYWQRIIDAAINPKSMWRGRKAPAERRAEESAESSDGETEASRDAESDADDSGSDSGSDGNEIVDEVKGKKQRARVGRDEEPSNGKRGPDASDAAELATRGKPSSPSAVRLPWLTWLALTGSYLVALILAFSVFRATLPAHKDPLAPCKYPPSANAENVETSANASAISAAAGGSQLANATRWTNATCPVPWHPTVDVLTWRWSPLAAAAAVLGFMICALRALGSGLAELGALEERLRALEGGGAGRGGRLGEGGAEGEEGGSGRGRGAEGIGGVSGSVGGSEGGSKGRAVVTAGSKLAVSVGRSSLLGILVHEIRAPLRGNCSSPPPFPPLTHTFALPPTPHFPPPLSPSPSLSHSPGVLGLLQLLLSSSLDESQHDMLAAVQATARHVIHVANNVVDSWRIENRRIAAASSAAASSAAAAIFRGERGGDGGGGGGGSAGRAGGGLEVAGRGRAGAVERGSVVRLGLESAVFDLRCVVDEVVRLVAGEAREKEVELAALVMDSVPTVVVGDPLRLRQVNRIGTGGLDEAREKGVEELAAALVMDSPTVVVVGDPLRLRQVGLRFAPVGFSPYPLILFLSPQPNLSPTHSLSNPLSLQPTLSSTHSLPNPLSPQPTLSPTLSLPNPLSPQPSLSPTHSLPNPLSPQPTLSPTLSLPNPLSPQPTLSPTHSLPNPLSPQPTLSPTLSLPNPLSPQPTLSPTHSLPNPLSPQPTLSPTLSLPNALNCPNALRPPFASWPI
ncbi:unnamed protein product [Closterium sp. Naga37s-1]|nr:unnamed protein product [Closterium sp. Naga37s-1]